MAVSCAEWIFSTPLSTRLWCVCHDLLWLRYVTRNMKWYVFGFKNSRKLKVILVTALFSLTLVHQDTVLNGRTWWSYNYYGGLSFDMCPVEQRLGFCKKSNLPKSKRAPHWASFAVVHINRGGGGSWDKGASLCSSAQSCFWGQRGSCFLTLGKEAGVQGHTLRHLWTENGKNILSNSTSLYHHKKSVYKQVKCKQNIFRKNKDKSITYLECSCDNLSNCDLTSNFNIFCWTWR